MHRFFATSIHEEKIVLDKDESRHLVKVLRLKAGEEVEVTNGKGELYHCTIETPNAQKAILKILGKKKAESPIYHLEIAAAPTKSNNRWEWFLEKATEIGIDAIHPIVSENSERKVLKTERQMRILKSAMKQSQKLKLPYLNELQQFESFVKQRFEGEKYIAHCRENNKMPLAQHPSKTKALILIGPEGDFSAEEIAIAEKHGYKAVTLGKSRLRTETAAIVACHTINLINA